MTGEASWEIPQGPADGERGAVKSFIVSSLTEMRAWTACAKSFCFWFEKHLASWKVKTIKGLFVIHLAHLQNWRQQITKGVSTSPPWTKWWWQWYRATVAQDPQGEGEEGCSQGSSGLCQEEGETHSSKGKKPFVSKKNGCTGKKCHT